MKRKKKPKRATTSLKDECKVLAKRNQYSNENNPTKRIEKQDGKLLN